MFLTIMDTLTLQRLGRFQFFFFNSISHEPSTSLISHEPSTSLIRSQVQTNILTILETMQTSVFAAGDVRNNGYKRRRMASIEVELPFAEEKLEGLGDD